MNFQDILNKWRIKCDINTLLSMWNESPRHWHTQTHLYDLIDQINKCKSKLSEKEYEKLIIVAFFHDCIYIPGNSDNEEKSADFFIKCAMDKNDSDIQDIKNIILDTKFHKSNSKLSEIFNDFDMSVVNGDYDELLEWEKGISEEFIPVYGEEKYKRGRIKFLELMMDKYPNNTDNLLKLVDWINNS